MAYISLDQAVLRARQLVQQEEERYRRRLGWEEIVWTEASSEQREDSYRVVLQFRRPARGLREEQTGEEEFILDHAGHLQFRQVLAWPEGVRDGVRDESGADVEQPVAPAAPPNAPPTSAAPPPQVAATTSPGSAGVRPQQDAPRSADMPTDVDLTHQDTSNKGDESGRALDWGDYSESEPAAAYSSPKTRANWAQALLVIYGVVSAVLIISTLAEVRMVQRVLDGAFVSEADLLANDSRQAAIGSLAFVAFILTAVLFLTWLHRVSKNLPGIGVSGQKFSPRAALVWWFIPIMWLF